MTFSGVPAVSQSPSLKVFAPTFIYLVNSRNLKQHATFNVKDEVINIASNFERFAAVSRQEEQNLV